MLLMVLMMKDSPDPGLPSIIKIRMVDTVAYYWYQLTVHASVTYSGWIYVGI